MTNATVPGLGHPTIADSNYRFLQDFIHRFAGIVIDDDKHYLLQSRLLPVAERERLKNVNDLCALLRAGAPALRQRVVEAMTTHETLFFRDEAVWEALRERILPELMKAHTATRELRIHCAGCSSGQEPYSLAMMLMEGRHHGWRFDIVATDISERILERARRGVYYNMEVERGIGAEMRRRYFTAQGPDWRLSDEVKRMVKFEARDLRQPSGRGAGYHLVLCRNVLIYFDQATKRGVIDELSASLARGGYLVLGGTESTYGLDLQLSRHEVGKAIVYRA